MENEKREKDVSEKIERLLKNVESTRLSVEYAERNYKEARDLLRETLKNENG